MYRFVLLERAHSLLLFHIRAKNARLSIMANSEASLYTTDLLFNQNARSRMDFGRITTITPISVRTVPKRPGAVEGPRPSTIQPVPNVPGIVPGPTEDEARVSLPDRSLPPLGPTLPISGKTPTIGSFVEPFGQKGVRFRSRSFFAFYRKDVTYDYALSVHIILARPSGRLKRHSSPTAG
jgi:hypothetical protein